MKLIKSIVTIATMVTLFASCSQAPKVPKEMFLIRGNLTNVPDSTEISLFRHSGLLASLISRDTVMNGQFEFCDSISKGKRLLLISDGDEMQSEREQIYVESGSYILIEGDGGVMRGWSYKSNHSKQNEYRRFVESGFPEGLEVARHSVEYGQYAKKITDYESYQRYSPLRDSIIDIMEPLRSTSEFKQLEYLRQSELTDIWYDCYYDFVKFLRIEKDSTKVALIKEIYNRIPQSYLKTDKGVLITSRVHPPTIAEVGDEMIDSKLYDLSGDEHTLSEFRGKYILLDFWSRGCGPCVASFPESEKIAERYADKLRFVSISSDSKEMWSDYVTSKDLKGYHWNELSDIQHLYNSYGVTGIPSYVMISPEGIVIDKWSGYGKGSLMKKVTEILD